MVLETEAVEAEMAVEARTASVVVVVVVGPVVCSVGVARMVALMVATGVC